MITVGMNYHILKGKEEEFETVFAKVLDIMGRMDGHVKTNLYRDVADPTSYMILSEWSARASFDAFIASDQFKGVTDWGKSKVLASQPKHEIYGVDSAPTGECPVHAS